MLVLTIDPHSYAVLKTSDGDILVHNNDNTRQRVGFDAPKIVKILRKELIGRDEPPQRAA